ncbi:protein CYPRO4-like [Hibiscus syriacus]|uniref:Protein CYPRO4-like n=1 Tax=Hibiscus syriacus TaxID=106335 RepID=A0A6A3AH73_HIBSY|nr:protein CYPRO4-like [Hibiscus syriacus]
MKILQINGNTLSLALFTDVTDSKELLESMQDVKLDPEVAFLNASLVPDVFPVLAAAFKTLVYKSLSLRLKLTNDGYFQITESLKRCGISENSSYVLAARFNTSPGEVILRHMHVLH